MEFSISLGLGGWALLIVGAIVIGVAVQLVGEGAFRYEWVVTAIAAGIGALVASQFIVDMRTFEPVWDGLAIIPALIGALIVGVVVGALTRYLSTSYARPSAV